MAAAGADVVINHPTTGESGAALQVAEEVRRLGRRALVLQADVSDAQAVESMVASTLSAFGKIDILVNNAGINNPQAIDEITDDVWDRNVEVDLTSVMALTRALVPAMKQRKWGRVIHISSVLGVGGRLKRNVYCACKAALIGLARASALDLGPYGITVNCLCPGPFLTDMPGKLLNDEEKKYFADRTALKRWAAPRELAGPALLLASEAGAYITGQGIVVDGGAAVNIL
jgi:NAD(P)-dependent dehydrogenase (short-subunit alcohol dehydrogenase family)